MVLPAEGVLVPDRMVSALVDYARAFERCAAVAGAWVARCWPLIATAPRLQTRADPGPGPPRLRPLSVAGSGAVRAADW